MKPPIKPIRSLYFRFIKDTDLDGKIEPQQLAILLNTSGLIELVAHRNKPHIEHYRDSSTKSVDEPHWALLVRDIAREYLRVVPNGQ